MVEKYSSFTEFFDEAESDAEYDAAVAAFDFVAGLSELMRENGISQAELARRIGKSQAYVTKVMRAEANFTLKTVTMLSRAAEGSYHNRVCRSGFKPVWFQQTARPGGAPAKAALRNGDGPAPAADQGGIDAAKSTAA